MTIAEPNLAVAPVAEVTPADRVAPVQTVESGRISRVLREEFHGWHTRLLLIRLLLALIPPHVGGRVRALLLRWAGFRIGRGTIMADTPRFTGGNDLYGKLVIGEGCWVNVGCLFDLADSITIGSNVSLGHEVLVLTNSHEFGPPSRRASTLSCKAVTIGDGAWLGSRCTILPGVSIGAGAIVAAGAVVNRDVPPNAVVAGVPARVVRSLRDARE